MRMNKKAQGFLLNDFISFFFIFLILALYFVFLTVGSFKSGEIKSVLNSEDKVSAYNYYPSLINFLNTKVQYDLNKDSIDEEVLMYDIFKDELATGNNKEIIEEKSEELFERLEYCYYDNGKLRKAGFMLFLSNGEKWDNVPFYDSWEVISFESYNGLAIFPKHLTKPSAYQQLSKEEFIYLYREEGIRADEGECDNFV